MNRLLLTVLFFLTGAYSIAVQIYCIRELLVVFFGNELCLGIIFACWFAGIGTGAACGAGMAGHRKTVGTALAVSLLLLALLPFGLLAVIRLLRVICSIPVGGTASLAAMALGSLLSVGPFSFMAGFVFPAACGILPAAGAAASRNIGRVYLWESLGSLAGGFAVSFIAIPACPPPVVFGWLALPLCAATAALAARLAPGRRARLIGAIALALAALDGYALSAGLLPALDSRLREIQWQTFGNRLHLLLSSDSRYHNIILAEADRQYSVFTNGTLWYTYPDQYQDALRAHLFLTQHPAPGRVLLLGGAPAGMLHEILKHPVAAVDCVTLDPALFPVLEPVLSAQDSSALHDPRIALHHLDGRLFVKRSAARYDVIIIDTPDPATAFLNRFYTVDFFRELSRILSDRGLVIVGLSATASYVNAASADYNGSLHRSLTHVFPRVMVLPGDRNYFFAGTQEGIYSDRPEELSRRYRQRHIVSRHFSPELFTWLVQREKIDFMAAALQNRRAPGRLNSDVQPVTYYYNLVLWDMLSGKTGLFSLLGRFGTGTAAALYGAAGLLLLVWVVRRRGAPERFTRAAGFWVIGTTGFAVMALEIVLIFMFQNLFGYVYEKIGIIVALFMLGLALGSLTANNLVLPRLTTSRDLLRILLVLEGLLILMAAALPAILHSTGMTGAAGYDLYAAAEYLFFILILALGLLAGTQFPLVCHLLIGAGYQSHAVAGWVNAVDHAGACCGALLTGTLLVPLAGTFGTCGAIAAVQLAGLVLLVRCWWLERRTRLPGQYFQCW